MSKSKFRGVVEWALMVALVFGAGALAQGQEEEAAPKVIQIGPADAAADVPAVATDEGHAEAPAAPRYWIGLLGEPVTADLRHHVEIPQGEGVVIRQVVPDSPAAKAGIEQYDIIVRANDAAVHDMRELADLVGTAGESKAQITLEVLRHGGRETVYVTPSERPAEVAQYGGDFGQGMGGGMGRLEGIPEELRGFLNQGPHGPGFNFRNFGPGVIVGGRGFGMAQMPNGVSVSIQKNDGEPARITVKRGDQTWTVVGDDAESLKQLPEDLRPFVERMVRGGGMEDLQLDLPQFGGRMGFNAERFQQRMEEMERRMQELQERLGGLHHDAAEHAKEDDTK